MKNYQDMSIDALEKENQVLMQKKAAIRREQLAIQRVLTDKRAADELAVEIKRLEARHGRKIQVLVPDGIDAEDAVNGAA